MPQTSTSKKTSLPKLLSKAQDKFNKYIRKRDQGLLCISCGKPGNQAGHYFPVKQFTALRFNEDNVHLQCPYCNLFAHGNQAMYRIGLVQRIGEDRVKQLEDKAIFHKAWKWDRTEVEGIIEKYARLSK